MTITQADLKRVRALHEKKFRKESKRFLVQGRKVVAELLGSSWKTETIYASEEGAEFVRAAAAKHRVPVHVGASHELDKIGTFETGNELIAVAIAPDQAKFKPPVGPELMLALDGIRDPRNMGSLLRIADWFGVTQVMCSPDCMEIYNPKVVQSTMGSLFRVQVRYANLGLELSQCKAAGATVYLASMDGAPVFSVSLTRPAVLVLGSESHGLSDALRAENATVIAIPRVGHAESLNVAMAASALCTEFTRQAMKIR